jgi:GT2 family glycosyltransferase
MGVKTLIAIPCFDMVNTSFMESLVRLKRMPDVSWTVVRNTLIHDARNIITANAIESNFDRVMWFDSDMVFEPDTLLKLSQDMDENNLDFVTGLYFTRRPPNIRPVVFEKMWFRYDEDGKYDTGAENYYDYPEGLFECDAAGFGCCLTSVDLLRRVGDKFGAPFQPMPTMGEDMTFCWRAKEIGAKLYCDSRVKCGHEGTFIYSESVYNRGGN